MAISEDTTALVAAQLTAAWASRMGQAGGDDAGNVGPALLSVYRKFISQLDAEAETVAEDRAAALLDAYRAV